MLASLIRFCHYNVYLGRDNFPNSRQTGNKIPHPVPKFWQIPNPVKIFFIFPNPAPYFGQMPSNHENTLPDPDPNLCLLAKPPLQSFLTLSTPIPECKFSLLVSLLVHFVEYLLGELVYTSGQFIFGDHFRNSHDLYVLQCTDMMRRNLMLIPIGGERVKEVS